MDKRNFALKLQCDEAYKFFKGIDFRANGVDNLIICYLSSLENKVRHIFDVDRLEAIGAGAENGEEGKTAYEPGDIVDQNIFVAKDYGWADDGVGEAGVDQCLLQFGFPFKVGQARGEGGVCNADMYDALNTGLLCRVKQDFGISNSLLKGHGAMGETNPKGIIEGRCTFKAGDKSLRVIKMKGKDSYLIAKWIGIVGMSCEGSYLLAICE